MKEDMKACGVFTIEKWRNGKCISVRDVPNLVTTVGKNLMLDVMFHGTSPVTTWYIGLINSSGYSAVAAGDTMASHAGWTEMTSYDESVRQTWVEAAASGGSTATSSVAVFTISATVTIKGLFLTSDSTKSGTTGTLWCATLFSSDSSFVDNDEVRVSYTPSLT
jgi:predicted cobalt transporter CbtA